VSRTALFDLGLAIARVAIGFYVILGALALGGWVVTQVGLALGLATVAIYAVVVWFFFRILYVD